MSYFLDLNTVIAQIDDFLTTIKQMVYLKDQLSGTF